VLAVDVPSGVDASTGRVDDLAVCADLTVTFHAPKPGLWIAPGKQHAGRVVVVDIGIEPDAGPEPQAGLIEDAVLAGLPPRGAGSTKFDSGVVVVVGGSRGLTGAPCLASEAAQRGGAGYVTACIPASLNVIFELRLLEAMTVPLPDADGALAPEAAEPALARAARAGVLVLGPGFGRAEGSLALARELAQRAELPVVIDADGLNAHAERLGELAGRAQPTVLTPHAGELGRLLGEGSDAVEAARLESARRAAAEARAIVVLKGDDSIVAEPDGRAAVARGDSPGLATAGTGDVLSGLLAALIGRGLAPFHAACAAVHAHQVAGRLAADAHHGPEGVIARDVIEALPAALAS
jgi:hydroxyethylthiazole kinase-like uncharacterized protein yjeF